MFTNEKYVNFFIDHREADRWTDAMVSKEHKCSIY